MAMGGNSGQRSEDHNCIPASISELSQSWQQVWNLYLRWFSWHTGLHFFAFYFIFSVDVIRENYMVFASAMMSIFAFTGFCASVSMVVYDGYVRSLLKLMLAGNAQAGPQLVLDPTKSLRARLRRRANLICYWFQRQRDPHLKSLWRRRRYRSSLLRFYIFDGCRYPLFGPTISHAGKIGAMAMSFWILFIWLVILVAAFCGGFVVD
ncbi:hypothetical protein FLO80_11195 [Aquicoccus porphyridii]|uniref:Uncharacterized protein n=1 Tax=Aquicoccus porphyridii TaxID=1852029 RepID=A0A5A9ZCD1_9RHOB|nr:hypothetical protein [Aquicoccus porphyridii]KAA0914928.1 hypothetical protein FLO80_11195 [Aquicoccus porphyridii]